LSVILPRVRVKYCGMTRPMDVEFAANLGVDAVGFIFYEGSQRFVSIDLARACLNPLPLFMDVVGVFVNPTKSVVEEVLQRVPLDYLQFHGVESPEFCRQFGRPYIKAIQASSSDVIKKAAKDYGDADGLLIDTPSESSYGGTGQLFDWAVVPDGLSLPLILAGGLNSRNIASAIEIVKPDAIDVCGGVELLPGIKDQEKMRQLLMNAWGG
jgi:phosphoribosylanthranilate isomerase